MVRVTKKIGKRFETITKNQMLKDKIIMFKKLKIICKKSIFIII